MLQWIKGALARRKAGPSGEELYRLGEAEASRRNNDAAAGLFRRAIALDGGRAQYHFALGCVLQASGRAEAAIDCYRRVLSLDSAFVPALINLGSLLQALSEGDGASEPQFDEALALFRRVTELAPGVPDGWINLGFALERHRRLAEARAAYDHALAIDPMLADARFNRSLVLLAQGDYPAGLRDYEFRWPATGYPRPAFARPEWDGRALSGETVFLYTEQGFGDAIQFVRYVAQIAERGGRALVRCQPELRRLFDGVRGVAATLAPDALPQFDFHCSLLSLARLFGTTIDTIPAQVPYLLADPRLSADWGARLRADGSALRVGLVWSSQSLMPNASSKSTTLQALAPLREVPGVRYYSLQLGSAGREAASGPVPMVDHTGRLADFADTAALIDNLDLVIAVDTAVAHLAGALGKAVWTMLRHAPDWRWYPDSMQSKWYPTMRLYRQRTRGDWRSTVEEVARDLRQLAAGRGATSPT